jgi:phage FluMu protein Com
VSILMRCPSCDKQLKADDEKRGRKIRCPRCQEVLTIPGDAKKSRPADDHDDERLADKPIPARRRRDEDEDDHDDLDDALRVRGQRKSSALPWILAGGGAVLGLAGVMVAVIVATKEPAAQVVVAPPGNVQPGAPQAMPIAKPQPAVEKAEPIPAQPPQPIPKSTALPPGDMTLTAFILQKPDGPTAVQVDCKLATYYNYAFRVCAETHHSFHISTRGPYKRCHVYAPKDSDHGSKLYELLKNGETGRFTLQIQRIGPTGEVLPAADHECFALVGVIEKKTG